MKNSRHKIDEAESVDRIIGYEVARNKKVYALIIYDIVDNKKRTKFSNLLLGYGDRVQKSGFEIKVSERKFEQLLKEIPMYCDTCDSIRVYRISGKNLVYKWGTDKTPEQEDVIVI